MKPVRIKSYLLGLCIASYPLISGSHPLELLDDPHDHEIPTLPASNKNVNLIGKQKINQDFDERVSDVAVMGNYAYLGIYAIGTSSCNKGGVVVFDISTPSAPKQISYVTVGNNYSYVGEGVQVIKVDNQYFKGDLLIISAEVCNKARDRNNPNGAVGGITLVDVNNPKQPKTLIEGYGDLDPSGDAYTPPGLAHGAHSVFAWTQMVNGKQKVWAAAIDIGDTGIDIMDITDPLNPVKYNMDYKVAQKFPQISQAQSSFVLKEVFAHDLTVKDVIMDNGEIKKIMVLSNWDSGFITLDVTDPSAEGIKLVADTEYNALDLFTEKNMIFGDTGQKIYGSGSLIPTPPTAGNAHYAEISPDNKYILGTDEAFGDKFINGFALSWPTGMSVIPDYAFFAQGETDKVVPGKPPVSGQTVFVGRACPGDASVPQGDGTQIAVMERGVCLFSEKIAAVKQAGGYVETVIMNREGGDACDAPLEPLGTMGVGRDVGYNLFGIGPLSGATNLYNQQACLVGNGQVLAPIAIGTKGATISLAARWIIPGHTRLYGFANTNLSGKTNLKTLINEAVSPGSSKKVTLTQLAEHTIAENKVVNVDNPDTEANEASIHMPVHEVTWSKVHPNVAYLSHYNGGIRVVEVKTSSTGAITLEEVGHFVENANDMWGVQLWEKNGKEYFLASDLNSGIYIFEYIPARK